MRRLNDPYPLPVSWAPADLSLTDSWDSLEKLAASGAGWPEPPPAGTWAAGPDGLAGRGGALVEVLGRVPTGRLVVLGEPGAGKTMLMVRLVLDLLARRAGGGLVPRLAEPERSRRLAIRRVQPDPAPPRLREPVHVDGEVGGSLRIVRGRGRSRSNGPNSAASWATSH